MWDLGYCAETDPFYLCRTSFAKDVPESERLVSSPGDNGLSIRGHGLWKRLAGLGVCSLHRACLSEALGEWDLGHKSPQSTFGNSLATPLP